MNRDSTMIQPKRLKIETPIGSVESDSGNHAIDILSIALIICLVFIGKKILGRFEK
tara:strand:+ start:129 stop:296 length:168 start_codon:yes stop_codon:yes gene_type:complete